LLAGSDKQTVRIPVFERSTLEPNDKALTAAKECTAVFWPLNSDTGEILTDTSTRVKGASHVSARLVPGDYLVVVDIPGHGFHEVFRHVAAPEELPLFGYNQYFFTFEKDGTQALPAIEIPPARSASNGMALVRGGVFQMGPDGGSHSRPREVSVADFWMDRLEVTIAEFRRIRRIVPLSIRDNPEPEDRAVHHVNWFEATAYAESIGKRLPEEAEYEAVATNFGGQKYPWKGADVLNDNWPLDAVGHPEEDRAEAIQEIGGLFSNVAEWTRSWANFPSESPVSNPMAKVQRVVRGAPPSVINGDTGPFDKLLQPRTRMFHAVSDEKPGLGFRCVRSDKPRLRQEDFDRSVPD
jgi:hypothetical protein